MNSTKINGEATTFGTSGLLYRSNKLMYDRATNSLWNQLIGEPVIGTLADSGIKLLIFPSLLTTWGEWLAEHPDTTVLSRETGSIYSSSFYEPESDSRSIYYSYRTNPESIFPVWNRDSRLVTKDEVLGLSFGEVDKAYPVEVLNKERIINDVVGGTELVIIASAASSGSKVYARQGQVFSLSTSDVATHGLPMSLIDSNGVEWQVTEEALVSTSDSSLRLPRLSSQTSFWFGWFAFHPNTLLYEASGGN